MKSLVFIAFLIAGAFSKPLEDEDDKIVHGYSCYRSSVPYQVSLQASGVHFCGGALIASQWVLTSAQCFRSNINAVLGENDMTVKEGSEQIISVFRAIRHPFFNSRTLDNDIMLLKLAIPATLNSYVRAVALPSHCVDPNVSCLVSGWGNTVPTDAYNPSKTLQCLDSPTVSDSQCFNYYESITFNMFCAGYVNDSGTCKGDEGGPLVCEGQVQGIVSWGNQCNLRNYPWVYTKVCNYIQWIQDIMKKN